MSPLAATLRSFQELVAGNAKFKRHRYMKQKLRWNCQGCSITDLRLFLEELLSQKGAEEPIVESGGVYGVSADFDRMNTDLVLTELACDARFKRLDRDDFSRLMGFFTEVFGNRHLRNRNPLHFSVIDCCLISNTLNVPKQIFGFPFACYATDGLEAMSLVLFASKARNTPAERPVVLYAVGADRKRRDFEIRQCCRRIGLEPVRLPTMSIISTPKSVRDRCVVVLGVALDGASISELSQSAARAKLSVHLHVIDAQFRRIFSENADDRLVHLRLPENVRSGWKRACYPADMRCIAMPICATTWTSRFNGRLFISLRTKAEVEARSQCTSTFAFGFWVECSPCYLSGSVRERRTTHYSTKYVQCRASIEVGRNIRILRQQILRKILNLKGYITEDWLARRLMLFIKSAVCWRTSSLVDRSFRDRGGTRASTWPKLFSSGRGDLAIEIGRHAVMGNPHLAVERAERRLRPTSALGGGRHFDSQICEAVRHDDVVAVYSQRLSYTDARATLCVLSRKFETENLRRESPSMPPVVHINDCCLAFNACLQRRIDKFEAQHACARL